MSTFSSTNTGIVLSRKNQNPATIVSGAYVTNSTTLNSGDALYGDNTTAWNVANFGTLHAAGSLSSGIDLRAGGTVTNATTAVITGYQNGIAIGSGYGKVTNYGSISATFRAVALISGGVVINGTSGLISGGQHAIQIDGSSGTLNNLGIIAGTGTGSAVYLDGGGEVTNGASGSTSGRIHGGSAAVRFSRSSGTVNNFGTIAGGGTYGVYFVGGKVINNANALITGPVDGVFSPGSAAAAVDNLGTIVANGITSIGVALVSDGLATQTITNASGGTISGGAHGVEIAARYATLKNSGTISQTRPGYSGYFSAGLYVSGYGGYVNNEPGGVISGTDYGVAINSSSGSVVNFGTITETAIGATGGAAGVWLRTRNGGAITNFGVIIGDHYGISVTRGGVTNASSGTIVARSPLPNSGAGVYVGPHGTLFNQGTIQGSLFGILVSADQATANAKVTVYGSVIGATGITVFAAPESQTLTVGGSVTGTAGTAVSLSTGIGGRDRLILQPGAAFQGLVDAGYGAGVLELASAASTGTISGLGTSFKGFGTVGIDPSSAWTLSGSNALGAGVTLRNSGTLTVNSDLTASGSVYNSGLINISPGAVFSAQNGVVGPGRIAFSGSDGLLKLGHTQTSLGNGVQNDSYLVSNTIEIFGAPPAPPRTIITRNSYIFARGTIVNYGTLKSDASAYGDGIHMSAGGLVANGQPAFPNARIDATRNGIEIEAATVANTETVTRYYDFNRIVTSYETITYTVTGTALNYGVVTGTGAATVGVYFPGGGAVMNAAGAAIGGAIDGVRIRGGVGSVINSGTITGGIGVDIASGSTTTVSNSGTIAGTAGTAVSLGGGSNRLILSPGAAFQGKVDGGGGKSVLEIAASPPAAGLAQWAQNSVAYVNIGSIVNFSLLQLDPTAALNAAGTLGFDTLVNQGRLNLSSGDALTLGTVANGANAGSIVLRGGGLVHFQGAVAANQTVLFNPAGGTAIIDQPTQFAGTIGNFTAIDLIDLSAFEFSSAGKVNLAAGNVLQVIENGGTVNLQLDPAQNFAGQFFHLAGDGGSGTNVTVTGTLSGSLSLTAVSEGTVLASSTTVANFTDRNAGDVASGFTATVNWGDGSAVTTATVAGSNGSFTVSAGHTYADEGSAPLAVTITRTIDNAKLALNGTVSVAESDALTAQPWTFTAVAGQSFSGTVAAFSDSDTLTPASDLSASIDWGDGSAITPGAVSGSSGAFTVSGSHTYTGAGQRTVAITLSDDGSGTATATSSSTSIVGLTDGRDDFLIDDQNSGELDIGKIVNGSAQFNDLGKLGSQLHYEGSGDYLGTGHDDILMAAQNTGDLIIFERPLNGFTQSTDLHTRLGTQLQFSTGDYLGHGRADFGVYDHGTGEFDIGEVVNGAAQFTNLGILGAQLEYEGSGDYLGTGYDDILMYDQNTGDLVMFERPVNGFTQHTDLHTRLGAQLQFATGNYLGHGKADFVAYDRGSGELDVGEVVNGAPQFTDLGILGAQWQYEGSGDYLGNSQDGILMYNQNTGDFGIYQTQGGPTQFTDLGVVFGAQWQYEGSGDYLGNGEAGFLLFNATTGNTELIERLNRATQSIDLHTVLGTQWLFKGTGNYLATG